MGSSAVVRPSGQMQLAQGVIRGGPLELHAVTDEGAVALTLPKVNASRPQGQADAASGLT